MKKWSVYNYQNDFLGYVWAQDAAGAKDAARTEYDDDVYVLLAAERATA